MTPTTPHCLQQLQRCLLITAGLLLSLAARTQTTLAFQGAEPGDTWTYTSTGADAVALAQALMAPNKTSGTASLVAGGNTAGGNCFDVGSGNGPSTARTFTFGNINISSSNTFNRTLRFNWGNRFPVCTGTGWDSGENLVFTAYHDGVAQPAVTLATGYNNAAFSIGSNQYTWNIPPCVNNFYFKVTVTTNRRDELLFVDDVTLTAPALNPAILQPSAISGDTTVCPATAGTYSVIQVPGTLYTWSGLPAGASFTTANGTAAAYTMGVNWGSAVAGTYTLTVTPSDQCGTVDGPPRNLTIHLIDPPTAHITASGPTTFCAGDSVILYSAASTGNTWSTGDTTAALAVNAAGIYTLTVTNACGIASISDTVNLHPPTTAGIVAGGSTTLCPGDTVSLGSVATTGNSWSTGDTSASISTGSSGLYILTVTGVCGTASDSITVTVNPLPFSAITASGPTTFCAGDSVILYSGSATGNAWSTGDTTATITVSTAGTYVLAVSGSCGTATDTQTVVVNSIPVAAITASGPTTFCTGDSVILYSVSATGNTWSTGDTTAAIAVNSAGTYVLTVSGSCGSSSAAQTITVHPLPSASITGSSNNLCPGDSIQLTATGGSSFVWTGGQTTAGIYATSPGTYTVTASNGCGTSVSMPYTITGLNNPVAVIHGNDTLCPGSSLVLTASGGSTYLWSTGSSAASVNVNAAGVYSVTASNSCGSSTTSFTVTEDPVSAGFTADITNGTAPLTVHFTNTSTGAVAYAWDFGNGSSSTAFSPSAQYDNGGLYTVLLTAVSARGCTHVFSMDIVAGEHPSYLEVPNVFTPNGDGINDVFKVKAAFIVAFSAVIYNRWGNEISSWQDAEAGWDGKDGAGMVTEGVYYYVIRAEGADGKVYSESGSLNLAR